MHEVVGDSRHSGTHKALFRVAGLPTQTAVHPVVAPRAVTGRWWPEEAVQRIERMLIAYGWGVCPFVAMELYVPRAIRVKRGAVAIPTVNGQHAAP